VNEEETVVAPMAENPKKPSGAQRKKDNRKRVKNPKTGVWELEQQWQPHDRVLRGRQNK
jgi:hypothetical protein